MFISQLISSSSFAFTLTFDYVLSSHSCSQVSSVGRAWDSWMRGHEFDPRLFFMFYESYNKVILVRKKHKYTCYLIDREFHWPYFPNFHHKQPCNTSVTMSVCANVTWHDTNTKDSNMLTVTHSLKYVAKWR